MKALNNYIIEKFQITKDSKLSHIYNYFPKDKDDLIECIKYKTSKYGVGTKDKPLYLNDIDTSNITDMSFLFNTDGKLKFLAKTGYFDISNWNISNVKDMFRMFADSKFDGDLSNWDVHNVEDMGYLFYNSEFTGENGDISDWNVSNVENMTLMFAHTVFSGNIDKWNTKSLKYKNDIFEDSPLEDNPPKWYK